MVTFPKLYIHVLSFDDILTMPSPFVASPEAFQHPDGPDVDTAKALVRMPMPSRVPEKLTVDGC